MNGHELWRLRELGLGGHQVRRQESNFWSKYNLPVLQWTEENPRHGFGSIDIPSLNSSVHPRNTHHHSDHHRGRRERITLPAFLRDAAAGSSSSSSSFADFSSPYSSSPPTSNYEQAQRRFTPIRSARERSPPPSAASSSSSVSWEPPAKQMKLSSSPTIAVARSDSTAVSTSSTSLTPQKPTSSTSATSNNRNAYFLSSGESLRETCSNVFPQFAQEHHIDLGHSNKIFAAKWLNDDRIAMGTKCNSILVMDADYRKGKSRRPPRFQLYEDEEDGDTRFGSSSSYYGGSSSAVTTIRPLKSSGESSQIEQNCGIHAIDVNPGGTLFASGGDNPADLSVYRLPNFEPLAVGEMAHTDWLFDLEWLDDEYLISGSRDSTLALWRFPNNQEDMIVCSHSNRLIKSSLCEGDSSGPISGGRIGCASSSYGRLSYPTNRPIEVKKLVRFDKVRALTFNHRRGILASVSLNSYLHVLDIKTFRQRLLRRIDGYSECVCLCNSPDEDLLAIGSRSSFAFFDTRTWERVGEEKLPRRTDDDPHSLQSMMPSGVRSISWHGHMLTLGTGGGDIIFYDVRARKFLQCDCNRSLTLKISGGWLQQDEIYQEIFLNLPCPNAVYTHCYDQYGTRLFAAGGPIAASLVGNYAAMWE